MLSDAAAITGLGSTEKKCNICQVCEVRAHSTHQQPVFREPTLVAEVAANRTAGASLILEDLECAAGVFDEVLGRERSRGSQPSRCVGRPPLRNLDSKPLDMCQKPIGELFLE